MSWLESGTSGDSLAVGCLLAVRTQVALELERRSLLHRFHVRSRRGRVLQHNINDLRTLALSRLVGCRCNGVEWYLCDCVVERLVLVALRLARVFVQLVRRVKVHAAHRTRQHRVRLRRRVGRVVTQQVVPVDVHVARLQKQNGL